nr:uncharacterized protein LOC124806107 isoform X11 [Hydra vulgaris]
MNWVIKQILHRHLMQLLCHHLLWLVSLKTFFKKQLCIDLLAKTMYVLFFTFFLPYVLSTLRTFDAGLLFHQFLRFLQSTQPSTVPSTSETVAASTSALVGWSSTTNLLYLMASHKTCCTCLQATKLAVSICSLATWYWAEGGRFAPLL